MKKIGFMIAVLGTFFIACNKQEPIQNEGNGPQAEMVKTTFGASFAETKVTLDGYSPKWSTTDKIKVYYEGGSAVFTLTDGAGSQNATFTGYVPIDATVLGAAYPAGIASELSGGNVTFSLPQTYDTTTEIAAPMCAILSGQTLKFRNVTSLLKVTYQNNITSGEDNPWGGEPAKFMLYCEGFALTGNFSVGLTDGHIEKTPLDPDDLNHPYNMVDNLSSVSFTGFDLNSDDITIYIPIPAGSYDRFVGEFLGADNKVLPNTVKNIQRKTNGAQVVMGNNVLVAPTKYVVYKKWVPVDEITPGKYYIMIYQGTDGLIHVANWENLDVHVQKQTGFVAQANTSSDFADIDANHILYAASDTQLTTYSGTTDQDGNPIYNTNSADNNIKNIIYQRNVEFLCNDWNDGGNNGTGAHWIFVGFQPGNGSTIDNMFGTGKSAGVNSYDNSTIFPVILLEWKPEGYPSYDVV